MIIVMEENRHLEQVLALLKLNRLVNSRSQVTIKTGPDIQNHAEPPTQSGPGESLVLSLFKLIPTDNQSLTL